MYLDHYAHLPYSIVLDSSVLTTKHVCNDNVDTPVKPVKKKKISVGNFRRRLDWHQGYTFRQ